MDDWLEHDPAHWNWPIVDFLGEPSSHTTCEDNCFQWGLLNVMLSKESNLLHRGLRTLPSIEVNSGLGRSLVAALARDDNGWSSK